MELGEAAHESAIREVQEETGLTVIPLDMVGIYSKYIVTLENGDNCQTFATFFRMRITAVALKCDNVETFTLEFFEIDAMPALFCEQHSQMAEEAIAGRVGVFRCMSCYTTTSLVLPRPGLTQMSQSEGLQSLLSPPR